MAIVIAPVVRVCGDGNRASTEGCDDSNLVDGDGCSASCQIEPGYVCPINYIRGTSVCKIPDIALVTVAPASRALSVEEGATVQLTIKRTGIERTCTEKPDRSCTAKDTSAINCGQPLDGDTACPDNTDSCVFTADPNGGTQGSCALTEQAACTASLDDDTDGTACSALLCTYRDATCGQPAEGETSCPDNTDRCVFNDNGSCDNVAASTQADCLALDPPGNWTPNSQGTCAITTQSACTAAMGEDADGSACNALKCAYNHGSLGAGSVRFSTMDGLAKLDYADYTFSFGTINFAENEVEQTITVATLEDTVWDEPDETFGVALSRPVNGLFGESSTTTSVITITNSPDQVCSGWPPEVPHHAINPCSVTEWRMPSSNNCVARGLCPDSQAMLAPHQPSCEFIC